MSKPKINLLFWLRAFLCALLFLEIAYFAWAAETITIDTYYPSPYGVYKTLRLLPHDDVDPSGSCANKGELYFDDSDNLMYYCDGAIWTPFGSFSQVFLNNKYLGTTPGIRYNVTIGVGGTGGGAGVPPVSTCRFPCSPGRDGARGMVIVEW